MKARQEVRGDINWDLSRSLFSWRCSWSRIEDGAKIVARRGDPKPAKRCFEDR